MAESYPEALRQLSEWLQNKSLDGVSVEARSYLGLADTLNFHSHGRPNEVCELIGGAWEPAPESGRNWVTHTEPFLGFPEVTVFR